MSHLHAASGFELDNKREYRSASFTGGKKPVSRWCLSVPCQKWTENFAAGLGSVFFLTHIHQSIMPVHRQVSLKCMAYFVVYYKCQCKFGTWDGVHWLFEAFLVSVWELDMNVVWWWCKLDITETKCFLKRSNKKSKKGDILGSDKSSSVHAYWEENWTVAHNVDKFMEWYSPSVREVWQMVNTVDL